MVNICNTDRSPRLRNQTALNVATAKFLYTSKARPENTDAHIAIDKTVVLKLLAGMKADIRRMTALTRRRVPNQ